MQNFESLGDIYSDFYFKTGEKFDNCLVAAVGKYESCIELGMVLHFVKILLYNIKLLYSL